jgi:hypothetical protein
MQLSFPQSGMWSRIIWKIVINISGKPVTAIFIVREVTRLPPNIEINQTMRRYTTVFAVTAVRGLKFAQ